MSLPPVAFGSDVTFSHMLLGVIDAFTIPPPDETPTSPPAAFAKVANPSPHVRPLYFREPTHTPPTISDITVADVGEAILVGAGLVVLGVIAVKLSPFLAIGLGAALLFGVACQPEEKVSVPEIGFNTIIMPGFAPAQGWSPGEQRIINDGGGLDRPLSQLLEVSESVGKLPESDELWIAPNAIIKIRAEVEIRGYTVPGQEVNTMNLGLCSIPLADSKTRKLLEFRDPETNEVRTGEKIIPAFALFTQGTVALLSCDTEQLGADPVDITHPACTSKDAKQLFNLSSMPQRDASGSVSDWIGCFEGTLPAGFLQGAQTLALQYALYDENGGLVHWDDNPPHVLSPKIRVIGEEGQKLRVPLTSKDIGTDTAQRRTRYTWKWAMAETDWGWSKNFGQGLTVRGLHVFTGIGGEGRELLPSTIHTDKIPCWPQRDRPMIDMVDNCGQNVTPTYRVGALLPPTSGKKVLPMDWRLDFLVPLKPDDTAGDPPVGIDEPLTLELEVSSRPVGQ